MASISEPFIRRPVGTTLLAIGLFLVGMVAYVFLPVAAVPNVDFPMIRVSASRPGADPSVMAATVAAPLERRLGEIAGITQITSTSSLGTTSIQLQFAIGRNIDRAARDVQAAINASLADLPTDLPSLPRFRKANPAAAPVFVLALTSKTIASSAMYDVADTVIAQRISQVPGVGEVTVSGADQPAVRIALNPVALSNAGIATDAVRLAIINANPLGPVGIFNGDRQSETLSTNPQMRTAAEFRDILIKSSNGNYVRLSDVAEVEDSVRNSRSIAWFNKQPAVLIQITKQGDANVIDTVDRVKALIPELKQWIPAGVEISTLVDRTGTIRASVLDMQWTLLATAFLVMVVVFVFLRRITPTIAAGVAVPLALAGTCAGMWLAGFSINNLSLMALAISVGFVVDDAIVMIENMYRNLEQGMKPYQAALEGAKQIGFTVLSISLSLIAAFTPLIFMDGIVGRLLREFSLTLTFAIVVSTVVSLTITPMICAHYIKAATSDNATWFDRAVEGTLSRIVAFYTRTLRVVLGFPILTLMVFFATIALTVVLYIKTPKGYFPVDDSGFVIGATRASADISFQAMLKLQQQLADIVMADPAVAGIGSTLGGGGGPGGGGANRGTMFISLKPPEERAGLSTQHGDRPAAQGSLSRRRHPAVHVRGAGYPRRRPAERFRLPVHADQHRSRSAAEMGADRRQAHGERRGHHRHFQRPRSRRAATDAGDRPQDRLEPRRSRPGHRQRAQQRVLAAADLDHLYPAQPVHGGAGDRSEIPGRSIQPRAHLRRRRQWRAGAAVRRGALQPRLVAARGLSFAVVSLDHGVVQPAARRAAGGRHHQHPARGRRIAHAGGHPRQLRRQCRRFQQDQRAAAAADPRRAGGDVYRAGRALREPRPSPDHHLDAAFGRAGRAAGAAGDQYAADRDRLRRHHPADRHRQEERHHDGGFRPGRRTPSRPVVGRRHFRGLQRPVPSDPDDDAGGAVRRHSAGASPPAPAPSCAGRSASPSSAGCWSRRS